MKTVNLFIVWKLFLWQYTTKFVISKILFRLNILNIVFNLGVKRDMSYLGFSCCTCSKLYVLHYSFFAVYSQSPHLKLQAFSLRKKRQKKKKSFGIEIFYFLWISKSLFKYSKVKHFYRLFSFIVSLRTACVEYFLEHVRGGGGHLSIKK